jgi:hypothetical protein
MSAARFPSIDNRIKRSLPKFGARCTIKRPPFPLGIGAGVGLGFPKSLGNACASVGATKIAHAEAKTKRKRNRITLSTMPLRPQLFNPINLYVQLSAFQFSAFVSRLLPQRSTATSRLYRPCRSSHSLHSVLALHSEFRNSFVSYVLICTLKLVRHPVSLAPTLGALPSMSRVPRAPFYFAFPGTNTAAF